MTLMQALNKLETKVETKMPGMQLMHTDSNYKLWRIWSETWSVYEPLACVEAIPGGVYTEPNIDDPATKGCLMEIIRRVTGDPHAYVTYMRFESHWCVCWAGHQGVSSFISDGEALAQAIITLAEEQ